MSSLSMEVFAPFTNVFYIVMLAFNTALPEGSKVTDTDAFGRDSCSFVLRNAEDRNIDLQIIALL